MKYKFYNMNINCFIINLKRCPDKKERMIKRMENYPEIKYEFYEAIDGRELTDEYMIQHNFKTLDEWNDPFQNRKITKGEIGCSLSHYNVYKKAQESEHDITLVLEDDAIFVDDFYEKLNELLLSLVTVNNLDYDMCYLGRKKMTNIGEEYYNDIILYPSFSYWTIGYLMTRKFCDKIIQSNFIKNIIAIDEYLSLIGDLPDNPSQKYRKIYNNEIKIISYHENIINPEEGAFHTSDTEICSYLSNNNSELLILTVSTDENDALDRFIHSCNNYGLRYKVLGLNSEWTGGDMSNGPGGGMKLNLLKEELKDYNADDIILFSDSYDVIFLSDGDKIMEKYLLFDTDVVFSGEKTCWPDSSMETIFKDEGPYKYINSGGFIGKVETILKIIDIEFEDHVDDQYLIHSRYENFINKIKIDTRCEIFQTSSNDTNDIELIYSHNQLKNKLYETYPCHYHGNGSMNVKIKYNNNCNYLLKYWTPVYNYCVEKQYVCDKLIYIFVYLHDTIDNDLCLESIYNINYPKDKIILHISSINNSNILFPEYEYCKLIYTNSRDKKEDTIRSSSFLECKFNKCDYYLNIDPNVIIENKNIINELLSYNKKIICPLMKIKNNNWSNFWGDITTKGWYNQSFNYLDILNNNHKGCWNIPYINHIYLIREDILENIQNYYTIGYNKNRGHDMAFCENLRKNNYFMYLCNEEYYGYLKEEENKLTILTYHQDPEKYIKKYFHRDFLNNINDLHNLKIEEPIGDVLQFPFVNDIFCEELILLCEKYGKWSGATKNDSRIGYENVPSNDIHFTEIEFHKIWEDIIKRYISPVVSHHWGAFQTQKLNIAFVVKYEDNKFYELSPHHDSSSYTVNIALNEEYEGGEIKFIKKEKKIRNKKGYALIHPGRITHYHEGLKVIKGIKYICVSFVY